MVEVQYIINQPVSVEESLHHEFKEVKGTKPIKAIANAADEYVVAYLNSKGGSIYWGIRDIDRTVVGVPLSFKQRDELKKVITSKLLNIQPPITPTAYRLHLHDIYETATGEKQIHDLHVVEIAAPLVHTDDLYFTGGNEAFVKTDAGKKKLSGPELQDEILRRLQRKLKLKDSNIKLNTENSFGFSQVLRRAHMVTPVLRGAQILWVDDNPGNNIYERMALKSIGITADVAVSTDEALLMLSMEKYDVVVSDMVRNGINDAGLRLLRKMREQHLHTHLIYYILRFDKNKGTPPGAFGITAHPDELMHYILDVLEREKI